MSGLPQALRPKMPVWLGVAAVAMLFASLIVGNDVIFLLVIGASLLTGLFVFHNPGLGFGILFALAFFFAPLKDHFHSQLTFFMVDLVIFVMAAFWFMERIAWRGEIFPRTPLTLPILLMAGYSALLLANPGRNVLGSLAGFRSWNLGAVVFFLAYDMVRSPQSLRRYCLFLVALGIPVALYAAFQEPVKLSASDPYYLERHQGAYYSTSKGGAEFRPFSTTVSAGELGSTMVLLSALALALHRTEGWGRLRGWLHAGTLMSFLYALFLTASRSSQIGLAAALLCLTVLRRNLLVLGGGLLLLCLIVTGQIAGLEKMSERYGIFQRSSELGIRLSNPVHRAWKVVKEHPFGMGLGYTQGVPLHMIRSLKIETTNVDNGFGAALMEMGWIGLGLYAWLLWRMLGATWRWDRGAPPWERPFTGAALISVLAICVGTLAGNGLNGYPHALLLWFLLGASAKLAALREEARDA